MIRVAAAALLLLVGGPFEPDALVQAAPGQPQSRSPLHDQVTAAVQVVVRQRIIVRMPDPRGGVRANATPFHWREGNGPRCIQAAQIAGATPSQNSVDFILRDNSRIRARLAQRCAALDYYRGFYLTAPADGRICAARDAVRSRMGGRCDISEFRTLRPGR